MAKAKPSGKVSIHLPKGSNTGMGTVVTLDDGSEAGLQLPFVLSVEIQPIRAGGIVTAKIEMVVDEISLDAVPFMAESTLASVAAHYGLQLIPADPDEDDCAGA